MLLLSDTTDPNVPEENFHLSENEKEGIEELSNRFAFLREICLQQREKRREKKGKKE